MMARSQVRYATLVLAAALAIGAMPAFAQDDDDRAMMRLQAMSDSLKAADSYAFTAGVFFDELSSDGLRVKRYAIYDVSVRHPDRLAWSVAFDDGSTRQGVFDGTGVTFTQPASKTYSRLPFQGSVDEMLDHAMDEFGIGLPIADFLYSDIMAAHEPYVLSVSDLGDRVLPERTVRHLLIEGTSADWQIWIENNDLALPRRFVATFVRQLGDPEYMITFWKWTLNQASEGDFKLDIPADWEEVAIPAVE